MTDLRTTYLGFELHSPLLASASPLTGDLDTLRQLEAAGAAAVVLPSLFEEQIEHEAMAVHGMLEMGAGSTPEAAGGFFPELDDYNTGPTSYLAHIEAARSLLGIPVIASLNGATPGGWVRYARQMADAGASAIELNLYRIATDPTVSGEQLEAQELEVVAATVEAVSVPVAVKLGPFYSSLPHFATRLLNVGARGVVLFNRFYQPDIDLNSRAVTPRLVLSHSDELRLPLRWIAILSGRLQGSLAGTTGVHTGTDAAKLLLAGADVVMLASALLRHGPEHLVAIERELRAWMEAHEYESVVQLRGSFRRDAVGDPDAYERANYMRTLTSYSSTYHR